jgi:hypothetical protein
MAARALVSTISAISGDKTEKDKGQTSSDSSTLFEQFNAIPERALLVRGRHLFKRVIKDADEA